MNLTCKTCIFLFAVLFLGIIKVCAEDNILTMSAHSHYPPVMWREDNRIIGVGPELAEIIFKDLGVTANSEYAGPWKRVIYSAEIGDIDLVSGIYYTDERAEFLEYSLPFMADPVAVFVRKDKKIVFEKWEDLIGYSGVSTRGDSWGNEFDGFIKKNLNLYRVSTIDQCILFIMNERADYVIYSFYPGQIKIKGMGYSDMIVPLPKYINSPELHLAFSKKSPFRKYLPEVNRGIQQLKADGVIEQLTLKYLNKATSGKE